MKKNDVIGLGNTLMDFLIDIEDNALLNFNLKKGEMHLVDEKKAKEILQQLDDSSLKMELVPGGSAANTLKGVAFLGGGAILCGKVGKDKEGMIYVREMEKLGVKARIKEHTTFGTGHAVTFITPDAQRTFSVHLGAAIHLMREDVLEEDIASSKVLHLEGYQLEGDTKETVLHAIALAQKHGTLVSLDLADPGVVRRNKIFLDRLVRDSVDILFVNEEEAQAFTGLKEEEAVHALGELVTIAVVKIGKRGSFVCCEGKVVFVEAFPAKAIDTTGAGDSYAAGFLYGYCCGWNALKSGRLGSLLAARVVEQKGVRLEKLDATELKEEVESFVENTGRMT
jgi:sugar/nucleoside kinase (ribokinase family)